MSKKNRKNKKEVVLKTYDEKKKDIQEIKDKLHCWFGWRFI